MCLKQHLGESGGRVFTNLVTHYTLCLIWGKTVTSFTIPGS